MFFYLVYPLNRTKALMGRPHLDDYKGRVDSISANNADAWVEAGLVPDTFRVDTDGLTTLACLRCMPQDSAMGTVIILHEDAGDRDSILALSLAFLRSNYEVIAYDQRACGRSSGEYRGDGWLEGNDLTEIIAYLDLRGQLKHPVSVIGFGLGADAVMLSSLEEERIDALAAINPYLSSDRWLEMLKEKNGLLWFPFWKSVMWWYYELRSSYAAPYRELEDIKGVQVPTMLFAEPVHLNDAEVLRIKELSPDTLLTIHPTPTDESGRLDRILKFVKNLEK